MLPEDTHVQTIKDFLTTVLEERTVHQRKMHVLRSLFLAEHLQACILKKVLMNCTRSTYIRSY